MFVHKSVVGNVCAQLVVGSVCICMGRGHTGEQIFLGQVFRALLLHLYRDGAYGGGVKSGIKK